MGGDGTVVAALLTKGAVAGDPRPQVVLPDHTDLPTAAALQVEDFLRLNHAHTSGTRPPEQPAADNFLLLVLLRVKRRL